MKPRWLSFFMSRSSAFPSDFLKDPGWCFNWLTLCEPDRKQASYSPELPWPGLLISTQMWSQDPMPAV